ncbi:hypothetical protein ACWEO2_33540 [Nocardia sp. NPDC004278]
MPLDDADRSEDFNKDAFAKDPYSRMIAFLRQRYGTWERQPRDLDHHFFTVRFSFPEEVGGGWPEGSVDLYFQKSNLYLRGWTVDREDADVRFMAAWDNQEWAQGNWSTALAKLPYRGRGYLGATPAEGKIYVDISYSRGNDNAGDLLSKDRFFKDIRVLHRYLSGLNRTLHGDYRRNALSRGLEEVTMSLHRLARMTSEMARFDGYRDHLGKKWVRGIPLGNQPPSNYCWGEFKGDDKNKVEIKRMPPFYLIIRDWEALSKAADGTTAGFRRGSCWVSRPMAMEALGNSGARWKSRS